MTKRILVCGAGGFIGSHLVKRLKAEGAEVHGIDLKHPDFDRSPADRFILGDLRDPAVVRSAFGPDFDEVYQLAADMGGAGYIFTGDNDADIMHNSALINLNVLDACRKQQTPRVFYSSSACIYPEENQLDPANPVCSEDSALPANPDSNYGWEKLFSERLYAAYAHNCAIGARVARYHNVYGPEGTWQGGREKVPAALCRKVAQANDGDEIEVWGDGLQTRSFLFIDDCLEATIRLTRSDFAGPVNIGSEEMVTINELLETVIAISGKKLGKRHVSGPLGVRGRCSDNRLIREKLAWDPDVSLRRGLEKTYSWIADQVAASG